MSSKAKPKAGKAQEVADPGSMDKVRDLLFGAQVRDFDSRFDRLEDRLSREAKALRDDLKSRFDSLESYVKDEVAALEEQLKSESSERSKGLKSLDGRLGRLDERTKKGDRQLRDNLLSEASKLAEEIERKFTELNELLQQEAKDLRFSKTDRAALGDLLTEVGLRLKDELHLPEAD